MRIVLQIGLLANLVDNWLIGRAAFYFFDDAALLFL
jgi:hypothetical protein